MFKKQFLLLFLLFTTLIITTNCSENTTEVSISSSSDDSSVTDTTEVSISSSSNDSSVTDTTEVSISSSSNDSSVTDTTEVSISSSSDDSSVIDTTENLPVVLGFPIVGTNQTKFFDTRSEASTQLEGDDYYGQNANYLGNVPSYKDNGDGTVTDMVTGLMWEQSFDHNGDGSIDADDKLSYSDVLSVPNTTSTGGYNDWRVPTIKELYSLMMFSGRDVSSVSDDDTEGLTPFINTDYFSFAYGDTENRERLIDVQVATTAVYVSNEVSETVFGVNLADGRIKGYGTTMDGRDKMYNYLLVRGRETYGINEFSDNGDGTITDAATGLMWTQDDSDTSMTWTSALTYAEEFEYAGYTDWRLPDAKELQGIVDYTKSPATTNSATIDDVFNSTIIKNEAGDDDYPWYWSSTTHETESDNMNGGWGVYLAFGRCMGNSGTETWSDVHGAGAQRSDPKSGDPSEYEDGHGPQGDAIRIYNYVRLVRYTY